MLAYVGKNVALSFTRATIAVALSSLALAACGHHNARPTPPAPVVATSTARQTTLRPTEQLAGVIAPYQNVALQNTLAEPTDAVYVQEGDRISRGETLAILDTTDLRANLEADLANAASNQAKTSQTQYQAGASIQQGSDQLRAAQAALVQAQQTLAKDQADLHRYTQLYGSGYITQQQFQQTETLVANDEQAVHTAEANVSSARAQVTANGTLSTGLQASNVESAAQQVAVARAQADQVRAQIDRATIVSPIDGVVVNRNLNPGEYPGTRQIFTLQQIDPIFAVFNASGAQIAHLQTGGPVRLTAVDLPGRQFTGRLVAVLGQVNPGSTNFVVKAELRNPDDLLRSGMVVSAKVPVIPVSGVAVPTTAFLDDNHDTLMVVRGGAAHQLAVRELGSDGKMSVVSGVQAGQRVVRNGQMGISDGQQVAVSR
ncbi:MAG: efflux RND transporter periplasmic adaptor subunit [Candidatus Eremiobacteraeota bacterium]|nr:efflux RND transporter periplasmic adaptor subunit [Candidatus Eremiobacteraeota bacterium]